MERSKSETVFASTTENWIDLFKSKNGRSPRVLHIGNIANNAYNNAKLLIKNGLECDVICYDYYHIMGCPEWEDADFEGTLKDQFFPLWSAVNLNGFNRPDWFVQGNIKLCLVYLLLKRQGKRRRAKIVWHFLNTRRFIYCYYASTLGKKIQFLTNPLRKFLTDVGLKKKWRNLFWVSQRFRYLLRRSLEELGLRKKLEPSETVDTHFSSLINTFRSQFPNRADQLCLDDLIPYSGYKSLWQNLFKHYDIIQGYSTDPIWPLVSGFPYFAFEHGTLRQIPFEQTSQGRITALGYRQAEHIFVTNADCLENAHKIAKANERVTFINHPYDEDHGLNIEGWKDLRSELCSTLDADFLFFFPTRHDWVEGTGYADKANDIFLEAFCQLRQQGYRVGMVCCSWGQNIEQSKVLLQQKGCDPFVVWRKPMGTVQFEKTARACDVIVDQFKLGAFGGILFKAMAVGAPICTYLEEEKILDQYDEVPPVINCKTTDDIIEKILPIIADKASLDTVKALSRQWICKYHSSQETVSKQLQVYGKFLSSQQD